MRPYLTLAVLFICGLVAFGQTAPLKAQVLVPAAASTEDLQEWFDSIQANIDTCWAHHHLPCLISLNEAQKVILDELDRRDREKVQALTQALEGKRKP